MMYTYLHMRNIKNNPKGFAVPLIIAIVAIIAIGVGIYVYNNKKTLDTATNENVSVNSTSTQSGAVVTSPFDQKKDLTDERVVTSRFDQKKDFTDEQVVATINAELLSPIAHPYTYQDNLKSQFQYKLNAQGDYTITFRNSNKDGNLNTKTILGIYKGDLNNDDYIDALVWANTCAHIDNDCAYGLRVVLNNKDGTGKLIFGYSPDVISGWSGGNETRLDNVKIEGGIIYITSGTFKSEDDPKSSIDLPKQTKKFKIQGNDMIEVK